MKTIDRKSHLFFHFLVWSLLVLTGCSESEKNDTAQKPPLEEPMEVTVSEIQPWQKGSIRHFPGVVRPGRRAVLSTRVNGTIRSIRVQAGDQVTAGDLLARVESRDLEAVIAAAQEQLKAAEAAHDQAMRDVGRLQRLYQEDLIARNRLERARVKQQEIAANVEKIRAELDVQRINRGYAHITAPFIGMVSEVVMDEGSFTGPGQPVLVLEDRSTLRIDVPVPAKVADRLAPEEELFVVSPLLSEPLAASYVAIVPALEGALAGQILRLSVKTPPPALLPGQVVDVLLKRTAKKESMALPEAALVRRGQLTGAMVLAQEKGKSFVHLRWIRTVAGEPGENDFIPVSQGLKAGELVVLNPSPDLREGQQVRPVREFH
ncbi:MAG: efflux RND transporter periplasmic adaptor subunit [Desulfopila sp.]